jgi:peptidoglycan hydrolase CwlO-like protein
MEQYSKQSTAVTPKVEQTPSNKDTSALGRRLREVLQKVEDQDAVINQLQRELRRLKDNINALSLRIK